MNLKTFFSPQSIAIVGASKNSQKLGHGILKNIIDSGFTGKVFPINPNSHRILNLKCYASVSELPTLPELVIIVIPSQFVVDVIEKAAQFGTRNFVIISAGFKEIGPEGIARENKLKELIEHYHLNILGPNCLGFMATHTKLNASFAAAFPQIGKIAFASQSGAICTGILDRAVSMQLGFAYFVSIGNKVDIDEIKLLEFWENDPQVSVIAFYLEGISQGRKFLEITKRISLKKPIIIIYPGESEKTKAAISSHTGTLGGGGKSAVQAFKQSGITITQSLENFFDYLKTFAYSKIPAGENVAIITNAGGPAILTIDSLVKEGLNLTDFNPLTIDQLKQNLPEVVNLRNPLDVIGDATASRYERGIQAVLEDKNVDSVLVILTPQLNTEIEKTAAIIVKLSKSQSKPILPAFIGGWKIQKGIDLLNKNQIPTFYFPERAVKSIKKLINYSVWRRQNLHPKYQPPVPNQLSPQTKTKLLSYFNSAAQRPSRFLNDAESFAIIKNYQIPVYPYLCSLDEKKILQEAEKIGFPVVLKLSHPQYPHKTDINAIKLNLKNTNEVQTAIQELQKTAIGLKMSLQEYQFMVQKMSQHDFEVIIGAKRDLNFGPMIMFGGGGIYTEIYHDVSFRFLPCNQEEIEKMIQETKIAKVLQGYRGKEKVEISKIVTIITKVSQLINDFPQIQEFDINPLTISDSQIIVADVKIKV